MPDSKSTLLHIFGSEDIEEIYTNAHAAIREDPTFKPIDKSTNWKSESVKHKAKRLAHVQRQVWRLLGLRSRYFFPCKFISFSYSNTLR